MRRPMKKAPSISGLVVEYIVAIDVTRVRFPADALFTAPMGFIFSRVEDFEVSLACPL